MPMHKIATAWTRSHPGLVCRKLDQAKFISSLSTSQYRLDSRNPSTGPGSLPTLQLLRLWGVGIGFTIVTDDRFAKQTERASRGIDAATLIAEPVMVFFDGKIWIRRKLLDFNEIAPARWMNVEQMNHRGRKGNFSTMS
jgi:hypothetical protein